MRSGQYNEAIKQFKAALDNDPKNQTAVYHLILALRKSGQKEEIPDLLKRLAQLREQATLQQRKRNRCELLESDTSPDRP